MIDYIIKSRMSQIKSHQKIGQNSYDGKFRKIKVDDAMFFCVICKQVWAKVPEYINARGWHTYPKGNIPVIGKEKIECPLCKRS